MAKYKIVTIPDPVLRAKAASVPLADLATPALRQRIADMVETMETADGIGLAAPQIGLSQRLFIVATKDGAKVFINPKITKTSFLKVVMEEGCLSIPGVFGTVKRPRRVTIQALDIDGKQFLLEAEGLFARVIQHEYDHINGVLFTDKVIRITRGEKPAKT